jgi:hypothetical protein
MNTEQIEQLLVLDKKERLLNEIIVWLKSQNLWDTCRACLSVQITDTPKTHTGEFVSFLLVNALKNLTEDQLHNLALSLAVRDVKFSITEYKKQCEVSS